MFILIIVFELFTELNRSNYRWNSLFMVIFYAKFIVWYQKRLMMFRNLYYVLLMFSISSQCNNQFFILYHWCNFFRFCNGHTKLLSCIYVPKIICTITICTVKRTEQWCHVWFVELLVCCAQAWWQASTVWLQCQRQSTRQCVWKLRKTRPIWWW